MGVTCFYFNVDNVATLWADVKDRAKIACPMEEFHYGMREFAIYDYMLQFGTPLGSTRERRGERDRDVDEYTSRSVDPHAFPDGSPAGVRGLRRTSTRVQLAAHRPRAQSLSTRATLPFRRPFLGSSLVEWYETQPSP